MNFFILILYILVIVLACLVVTSKNPILAVIWLIGIYLLSVLILFIIGCEFLSLLLLMVYVGAVSILFLFVVMMMNLRIAVVHNTLVNYIPIVIIIGIFFILEFCLLVFNDFHYFFYCCNLFYSNELLSFSSHLFEDGSNLYLISKALFMITICF